MWLWLPRRLRRRRLRRRLDLLSCRDGCRDRGFSEKGGRACEYETTIGFFFFFSKVVPCRTRIHSLPSSGTPSFLVPLASTYIPYFLRRTKKGAGSIEESVLYLVFWLKRPLTIEQTRSLRGQRSSVGEYKEPRERERERERERRGSEELSARNHRRKFHLPPNGNAPRGVKGESGREEQKVFKASPAFTLPRREKAGVSFPSRVQSCPLLVLGRTAKPFLLRAVLLPTTSPHHLTVTARKQPLSRTIKL